MMAKTKEIVAFTAGKSTFTNLKIVGADPTNLQPNPALVGVHPGDPNEPFVGLYDPEWTTQLDRLAGFKDNDIVTGSTSAFISAASLGLSAIGMMNPTGNSAVDSMLITLGLTCASLSTPFAMVSAFSLKKRKSIRQLQDYVVKQNMEALIKWLKDRYSIEISGASKLKHLREQMHAIAASSPICRITIYDVNGYLYNLTSDRDGRFVLQDSSVKPKEIKMDVVEVSKKDFTGEAATFYISIITRQKMLQNVTLGVEKQHVFNRVNQNLAQVLQLHKTLIQLGSEDFTQVTNVLETLNKELGLMVQAELQKVQNELTVQELYLKNFNAEPGLTVLPANYNQRSE